MPYNNEKMLAPYGQENAPKKIKVVVADISDALEREAFTAAEARLTENKENSRGFKGVFKRIWKHNLFHEYYRQKELFIASQKIRESGNIYVNENLEKEAHDSAMGSVMERFTSEYEEEMIHEGEEKKTITGDSNDGGALKTRIRGLIQSYAKGNLSEEEFVLEKNAIFSHELQGIKGESGESITQKGKMYADNILEIARQVRQSIEHGAKLEDLDTDFDIVVGRARSGERTEAQFGRVDRWIEKIQKTKLGRLVNEATIAAAVSVVYAVGTKVALGGARTASKILGPLGFGLSAGIGGAVAGVRESKRLKEERAQHARERARGKTFEKGAERREEMEQFQYETKGASSLAHDLETNLERFKMNPQKAGLDKLLLHLNDVEGRIAFSDCNNVDLIHFSDVRSIEKERTRLDILRAETKVYLRKLLAEKNAGKVVIGLPFRDEATLKDYLIWAKEFRVEGKFSQEKAEKDKAFDKMKRMQVAKAVTKGFAIGLGVGVVAQEVATAFNDAEGIFTPSSVHAADLGGDPSAVPHYTSLEYMRRLLSGGLHQNYGGPYTETIIEQNHFSVPDGFVLQNSPSGIDLLHGKDVIFAGLKLKPDGTLTDESLRLLQSQGITTDSVPLSAIGKGVFDLKTVDSANYKLPQGFSFVKNPSGAYDLVGPNGHGGNISIENLKLNPDGSLSQEARDALMQRGVRLGSVTEHVSDARYEEAVIDPKEYVVRHADKFHRIKRTLWYDNNTPKSVFDKNELRLRWGGLHGTGIDSNGRFVMDVSHMTEEGSFHQGLSANAQELMKEGNLKILFSLTRGSQNNVIEVPIDASGHIGIDPNSENGKLLFGVDARGHAVFRGKFMEVAHSLGMKNGAEQMGVLATHEGNGLGPIRDIIDNPAVNKTSTIVEIAEHGTKLNIPSDYEVDWPFVIPMAGRRPLEPEKRPNPYYEDPYGADPYGTDPYGEEAPYVEKNGYIENLGEHEANIADGIKIQEDYLNKTYGNEKAELVGLAGQIPPMSEDCRMSINLPAYKEKNIYQTLEEYSVKQKDKKGEQLNPELFEVNVLINRRNDSIQFDDKTIQEVKRFKREHPEYHVNIIKKTFNFKGNLIMGQIYKSAADLALYRNTKRSSVENKSRLIMRTGGADAMDKNSRFLSTVLERFQDPKVAVYKSESRLPLEVIKKLPMLHVLYVLQSGLNRFWTKGKSNLGLGSFSAELYAKVGGFDSKVKIAEEVNLAKRMRSEVERSDGRFELKKDLVKNAIDDPRRYIAALYNKMGMANAYNKFGNKDLEADLRNIDWTNKVVSEEIPSHLELTAENLEREISQYYRQYLNHAMASGMTGERKEKVQKNIQRVFSRMLTFIGLAKEDYEFAGSSISIKNISNLQKLIKNRKFLSYGDFE